MSANWGKNIELSIFGESHGKAVGINIGNLPSGIKLDSEKIKREMSRRAPGKDRMSTARKETDEPIILSGILDGVTTGAPLCAIIQNSDRHSKDYSILKTHMRPGHSDYPAFVKYGGFNDVRGGGHFSGRLTAPLVFAGAVAKQILAQKGIRVISHIKSVHGVCDESFGPQISNETVNALLGMRYPVLNGDILPLMQAEVEKARENLDSVGGKIECAVLGIDAGCGEPFFRSCESVLSSILFSVPAVKGVEFGDGFDLADMCGSEANDCYYYDGDAVKARTNHNGGILGGITNGMPLTFTVAIKPTPSISKEQNTVDIEKKENTTLEIKGRHDPCIVFRALPVIEAAAALAILDIVRADI